MRPRNDHLIPQAFDELLSRFVPPSVLIDENYELIHSFSAADTPLALPEGQATLNILKMTQGELRTAVSSGLHRASQTKETVVFQGVRVADREHTYKVTVHPFVKGGRRFFLVCLEATAPRFEADAKPETFDSLGEQADRLAVLERELDYTRESLQSTVEELETSNEELQATNEELVASNEELQSTNEELHSVNEELYTVNAEHQRKIEELTELTNDINNLMVSTEIGTIFLDRDLRIRRFTPAIGQAFNVLARDIGRPIEHIAYNFESPTWVEDAKRVLQTGEPSEKEVRTTDGKSYLKRIHAYRTEEDAIRGVVLTFIELTSVEAAQQLQLYAEQLRKANLELQDFAYAVSHDLRTPLRQQREFGELLQQQVAGQLQHEAAELLGHLAAGARRAESMIEALLEYSRVETQANEPEAIDCDGLIDAIKRELESTVAQQKGRINSTPLPVVHGDAAQLKKVLRHLIDNAIRYCGKPPEIEVSAQTSDDWATFKVADNGIGIAKHDLDRVFIVFQSLGTDSPNPTNGIGLPLCKRIVERHGGRIWIESKPAEGTRVFFTLPIQDSENSHAE